MRPLTREAIDTAIELVNQPHPCPDCDRSVGHTCEACFIHTLLIELRIVLGDAHQMAGFLDSDRAPGETSWQSPWISSGSAIDKLVEKYEKGRA